MNQDGLTRKDAPSLESLHEVKLEALLHDLVKKGRMQAAQILGINYKTLARSIESGRLSVHVREALMTLLLDQHEADAGETEEAVTPEHGACVSVKELRDTVEAEFGPVMEEQARQIRELEERLAGVEVALDGSERPVRGERITGRKGMRQAPRDNQGQMRVSSLRQFRSTSPSVITMEPQPGDEQVYGKAWPLVDEWRRLRQSHPAQGRGLSWLVEEERMREMEIALIDRHELTMPPDTDPWDSLGRGTQVRWRFQTLERIRGERVRAQFRRWVRRLLTLGLWRK